MTVKKRLLIVLGFLSIGLALIGMFLPLLPTVPFVLLAAACFARSSDKLHCMLINHKILGRHLRRYYRHKGVSRIAKVQAIGFLWVSVAFTVVFFVRSIWIGIFLVAIALAVTIHISTIRTVSDEDCGDQETLTQ